MTAPRVVVIVQARMGSSRLPGKVLMDIEGRPMLERVVQRLKQAKLPDEIRIASSNKAIVDSIVASARRLGLAFTRLAQHQALIADSLA